MWYIYFVGCSLYRVDRYHGRDIARDRDIDTAIKGEAYRVGIATYPVASPFLFGKEAGQCKGEETMGTGEREFTCSDVYLSAAISVLSKVEPHLKVSTGGRVLFCYSASDVVLAAMSAYNSGASAPLLEFASHVRRLRSEMLARRGGGR